MFELRYRIVEDLQRLLNISCYEFDKEVSDFEGLIELDFNGNKIGYMFDGEITKEMLEVGCFQWDWIFLWFEKLLEVVEKLQTNDYLILSEIECSAWIKFTKLNDCLKVRELKELIKDTPNFKSSHKPLISTSHLTETVELKTGETFIRYVEFDETDFEETIIKQDEFESEILGKAKYLIKEVENLFPNLSNSKVLIDFKNLLSNIEQLYDFNS